MMYLGLSGTVAVWMFSTAALTLVSFLFLLILFAQNVRLHRKLRHWQRIHKTADLDSVYEQTIDAIRSVEGTVISVIGRIDNLEQELNKKLSTAEVKRFNAFSNTGSDLSYAVALLDDEHSGVVLSSIYGREESRTYAKPIVNGQSVYSLTEEEQEVIERLTVQRTPGSLRVRHGVK